MTLTRVGAAILLALASAACQPREKAAVSAYAHAADAGRPVHWGYEEDEGPVRWATLSPAYALCAKGLRQSPIDLAGARVIDLAGLVLDYHPASLQVAHHEHAVDVLDNGHTIQVTYDEGSTLVEGERPFDLVQYHFHAPSEHTVAGRSLPMEMHLVHKAADGDLAVLGVLIEQGRHNAAFDPIWEHFPSRVGETRHAEGVAVDIDDLLPRGNDHYFRYDGSLTTPPCSEGVRWFVMAEPIELSKAQIEAFTTLVDHNNRPTQPLHGRPLARVE